MYLSLKTLRLLFSIAPMLKSLTATMLKRSRSYSSPKRSSSQRIARFSESIAYAVRGTLPCSTKMRSFTGRPERVVKLSSRQARSPATSAKR